MAGGRPGAGRVWEKNVNEASSEPVHSDRLRSHHRPDFAVMGGAGCGPDSDRPSHSAGQPAHIRLDHAGRGSGTSDLGMGRAGRSGAAGGHVRPFSGLVVSGRFSRSATRLRG